MDLLVSAQLAVPQIPQASLVPIIIMSGGMVLDALVEAFTPAKNRRSLVIGVTLLTPLAAGVVLATRWLPLLNSPSSLGEYIEDLLSITTQLIFALIAFLTILAIADCNEIGGGAFASQSSDCPGPSDEKPSDRKNYQRSEMFPLTLFSLGGMTPFPVANSYVLPFVAPEVMSLPLYILVATARRRCQFSQEAGLKYFILDTFISVFPFMDPTFLYGFSGLLMISTLTNRIAFDSSMDWLVLTGVFLVMLGLLFKIGTVPLHAWIPNVCTGAPAPVTDFMAATIKVAVFSTVLRFYEVVVTISQQDLVSIPMDVAFLMMLVGTFTGIVQGDVKRILAFSSIAHVGFILLGAFSLVKLSMGHVLFYMIAYGIATVGAFGVVSLVRSTNEEGIVSPEATIPQRQASLDKENLFTAGAILVSPLFFAGISLNAGFVGKFLVFSDVSAGGLGWLVGFALVCSAVTAFYYFRLIRSMSFTRASPGTRVVKSEGLAYLTVLAATAATILLGVFPGPILSILSQIVILLP